MRIVFYQNWPLLYVSNLANELSKNHDVFFCYPLVKLSSEANAKYDEIKKVMRPEVNLIPLDYSDNLMSRKYYTNFINAVTSIRNLKPDIIHIQETWWRTFFLIKFLSDLKVVYTLHDPLWHKNEKPSLFNSKRIFKKEVLQYSNKIIVHGKKLKEISIKEHKIKSSKVHAINHGNYDIYKSLSNNKKSVNSFDMLVFGRLTDYKGIATLFKSLDIVFKKNNKFRLIIAGKVYNSPKVYEIKEKYPNNVLLIDKFIPNSDIEYLFNSVKIVILPYNEATQSGVLALSLSFGKAIITTEVGSIDEIIKNKINGYLVAPNNPEQLADAINELLMNNDLIESLSKNARLTADTNISWASVAEKHLEVYNSI